MGVCKEAESVAELCFDEGDHVRHIELLQEGECIFIYRVYFYFLVEGTVGY